MRIRTDSVEALGCGSAVTTGAPSYSRIVSGRDTIIGTPPHLVVTLEALNSKVRLLSRRAYGFHSADALIAMIYLCCAGIQIALPHR
jgi:hypothetical protein